jgi:hypothetical protein
MFAYWKGVFKHGKQIRVSSDYTLVGLYYVAITTLHCCSQLMQCMKHLSCTFCTIACTAPRP